VKADGCVFGGHSAALNYGDCFAYALAKASDAPLLRLMLTIMGSIAEFERGLIRASARMRASSGLGGRAKSLAGHRGQDERLRVMPVELLELRLDACDSSTWPSASFVKIFFR
jgi:hypothetical protein